MPVYKYKVRDKYGALFSGKIESSGKDAVSLQLDNLGYIPISIDEDKWQAYEDFFEEYKRISAQDMIIFSRQMATLIDAGIPFISSLDALIEQTENKRLRKVIIQIRTDVEGGFSFSDALSKHPNIFSNLYINMIKAGETAGVMDEVLERLANLSEHEAETKARIKAATRYPKIVVSAISLAFFTLVTFVVPKFIAMYAGFKVKLPLPTRILIVTNTIVNKYWHVALVVTFLIVVGVKKYLRTEDGAYQWDKVKLKLPVFGPIFLKVALSRFSRLFGTLIRSGIPVLQTLEIVSGTVGNIAISRVVDKIRNSTREGKGIVGPMKMSKVFPPVVIQMIAIGEETGKMEEMLTKVSEYYDRDVEYAIKNLATAIEPILLLFIGGMVLFLALAIFMPWWNLISVFKGGGG